jgi:Cu(I)/Ag(I) efflux system membrane fusion protein
MNKTTWLVGVLCLAGGMAAGYLLFSGSEERPTQAGNDQSDGQEKKVLFFRNPMNPTITSPIPTQDSMGMDYIPVYEDEDDGPVAGTVKIDPTIQANIGLRTAIASRKSLGRTIRAAGRVDHDEEKIVRLHPKVEGWIREMRIDKTGERVNYNDILLTIYSPKLVATQQEYLLALINHAALKDSPFEDVRKGAERLVRSSRERLVLLDVPEHQIVELERTGHVKEGLHIHAPADGTVMNIGARQGQFVTPGTELYSIVNLDTVWVYADIYEYELPWIKVGDKVRMTLRAAPGRTFESDIAYIYPYAQDKTRTTRIRVVFENQEGLLRPEMFADLSISASELPDQVVVPAESVVRSGDFNQIFVVTHEGTFEPRKVALGIESRGEVAVISGVDVGERVVVSAQFLIDSESKLQEATAKMIGPKSDKPRQDRENHEGMEHD